MSVLFRWTKESLKFTSEYTNAVIKAVNEMFFSKVRGYSVTTDNLFI